MKIIINRSMSNQILQYLNIMKRSVLIVINVLLFLTLQGQGKNEEVTIIAPFEPVITESNKINFKPSLDTLIIEKPNFKYLFQERPYNTTFQTGTLKPLQFSGEFMDSVNKVSLKTGGGNYSTTFVDFHTSFKTGKRTNWNARINHLASSGKIIDYAFPGNSHNGISIGGSHDFNEESLSGNLFFNRDVVHFYGFKPTPLLDSAMSDYDIKQKLQSFGAVIQLNDIKRSRGSFHYNGIFGFETLSDFYQTNETGATFDLNIRKDIEPGRNKKPIELNSDLGLRFINFSDSLKNETSVLFNVRPGIKLIFDPLIVEAGISISFTNDTASRVYFHPLLKAGVVIIPSILKAYGEITGNVEKNSFASLSNENPFINSNLDYYFTNTKYQVSFGLTGNFSNYASYNIGAAFSEIKNMPFFLNGYQPYSYNQDLILMTNRFDVVYDNVETTAFFAEVEVKPVSTVNLSGKVNYTQYALNTQMKPWHKPSLEIFINAGWKVTEKFTAGSLLYFSSKKYALNPDLNCLCSQKINPVFDLGFNGKYLLNKNVSVFLNINNITGNRYYLWYHYPSYRLNVLAGVNFTL